MSNITNSTTDVFNTFIPITGNTVPYFPRDTYDCDSISIRTPDATGVVAFKPLTNTSLPSARRCCGDIWIHNATCQGLCVPPTASSDDDDDNGNDEVNEDIRTVRDLYDCLRDYSGRSNSTFFALLCQDPSCQPDSTSTSGMPSSTGSPTGSPSASTVPGAAVRHEVNGKSMALLSVLLTSVLVGALMV